MDQSSRPATWPTRVRVLIIDDQALQRDALKASLAAYDEFEVVGEAFALDQSVRVARESMPDLVLMGLGASITEGLEILGQVRKTIPTAKVLVLSQGDSCGEILRTIRAGAAGCITKKATDQQLVSAIQAVRDGGCYLSAAASRALMETYRHKDFVEPYDRLTRRQKEILRLIIDGDSSRKISEAFNVSLRTVQNHRLQLMRRLGIRRQADLIEYAARKGLVSLTA